MQSIDKLDKTYIDEFEQEVMLTQDPVTTEAERIQRIVEAKYSKADLPLEQPSIEQMKVQRRHFHGRPHVSLQYADF